MQSATLSRRWIIPCAGVLCLAVGFAMSRQDHSSARLDSLARDLITVREEATALGKDFGKFSPQGLAAGLAAVRGQRMADFQKRLAQGLRSESLSEQANALLGSGRFLEAEEKSLEAARQKTARIDEFTGGIACYCRGDYRSALPHYHYALALVDRHRFRLTWAMLQKDLGLANRELGIRVHPLEGRRRLVGTPGAGFDAPALLDPEALNARIHCGGGAAGFVRFSLAAGFLRIEAGSGRLPNGKAKSKLHIF